MSNVVCNNDVTLHVVFHVRGQSSTRKSTYFFVHEALDKIILLTLIVIMMIKIVITIAAFMEFYSRNQ